MGRIANWLQVTDFDFVLVRKFTSRLITKANFASAMANAFAAEGFLKSTGLFAQRKVKEVSSNQTLAASDNLVLVDCTAGNVVLTIPAVLNFWDAALSLTTVLTIKRVDTAAGNTCTLLPAEAGETIDGDANLVLSGGSSPSVDLVTNGTNFFSLS